MTDEYDAWLDEALGAMIRYQAQLEPRTVAAYTGAFQGDPVGLQWLAAAAEESPSPSGPAADDAAGTPAAGGLSADLDPLLRATVEELLPHLSDEDRDAVFAMTADELAAAIGEARAESIGELVPPFPDIPTDEVLSDQTGDGAPEAEDDVVAKTQLLEDLPETHQAVLEDLVPHLTAEELSFLADLSPEDLERATELAQDLDDEGDDVLVATAPGDDQPGDRT